MGRGRYLTLEEVAREINKTVAWITVSICRGKLDAKLEGRRWLVSLESLQRLASASTPTKPETPIDDPLSPPPSREASAEKKPTTQEGPAHEATEAAKPTDKEKTDRRSIGGIDGYYPGRSEMERRHSSEEERANSTPRLLIARTRALANARKMQDRGTSRAERWRILKDKVVPALGLEEVAGTIASHCRTRKRQRGGRERYAHAIAEWEYDLARLKRELYDSGPSRFYWPRSEP
ncbi:MAG: hypothetical protein M3R38_00425 [Actinomycetota bacterium]|nr:hypothetical protein [Actinomycetota bacterium]